MELSAGDSRARQRCIFETTGWMSHSKIGVRVRVSVYRRKGGEEEWERIAQFIYLLTLGTQPHAHPITMGKESTTNNGPDVFPMV